MRLLAYINVCTCSCIAFPSALVQLVFENAIRIEISHLMCKLASIALFLCLMYTYMYIVCR